MNKKSLAYASALVPLLASASYGGGVEGSSQSISFLFEKGNYVELSYGQVNPTLSGKQVNTANSLGTSEAGTKSGNMTGQQTRLAASVKFAFSERLDLGFMIDQPVQASLEYDDKRPYHFGGTKADLTSSALTALTRYKLNDNFSVFGGIQYQRVSGALTIKTRQRGSGIPQSAIDKSPALQAAVAAGLLSVGSPPSTYKLDAESDGAFGGVLGVAFEDPTKAQLFTLTYRTKVVHDFDAKENNVAVVPVPVGLTDNKNSEKGFSADVPESLTFDWRTGISKQYGLALYGKLRWVRWSQFELTPPLFAGLQDGESITNFDDTWTVQVGLAKRFNKNWIGSIRYGMEKSTGSYITNLAPKDGYQELALSGAYQSDKMKVTAGISYAKFGDAKTKLAKPTKQLSKFENNSALSYGLTVGFYF